MSIKIRFADDEDARPAFKFFHYDQCRPLTIKGVALVEGDGNEFCRFYRVSDLDAWEALFYDERPPERFNASMDAEDVARALARQEVARG